MIDPEIRAAAIEARRTGRSLRDVARVAGVTPTTVMRWVREADAAALPPAPPAPEIVERAARIVGKSPPEDEPEPNDDPSDPGSLAMLRRMLDNTLKLAKRSEREGNMTNAQKFVRDATEFSKIIARAERSEIADADVLRISRADIDAAMGGVRARVQAICSRPLLCAACGRALSVAWGTGTDGA